MKPVSLPRHCYLGVFAALLLSRTVASAQPFTKTASVPLGGTVTATALAKTTGGQWHFLAGLGNGDVVLVPIESGTPGALARTPTGLPGIGGLAIGDLNNDGMSDVVAANYNPGNVVVLLQGSSGVLGGPTKYPIAGGATGAAIADWNGDGLNDVLVPLYTLHKIAVFPNQGGGSLGSPAFIDCGRGPNHITTVDLYANGHPGVATANYLDNTISVLAPGGITPLLALPAGQGPAGIDGIDLNGDGGDDILCINQSSGSLASFTSTPGSPDFGGGGTELRCFRHRPWSHQARPRRGTRGPDQVDGQHPSRRSPSRRHREHLSRRHFRCQRNPHGVWRSGSGGLPVFWRDGSARPGPPGFLHSEDPLRRDREPLGLLPSRDS